MPVAPDDQPLVSIGIPTYNRADLLHRSVESALAQDHRHLEVLIADNASTDGTVEVARTFERADGRVRVLTSDRNAGPTANFNRVRAAATGDFFMWLGDDDWIDETYVSSCLAALQADPGAALAAGRVVYHDERGSTWPGVHVEPASSRADRRVVAYWRLVRDNGAFYGLVPTAVGRVVAPLGDHIGNDLNLMAALAFLGRFRIVETTAVHRAVGGATTSMKRVAEVAGLPRWQGALAPVAIAWFGFWDIAWSSPVYRRLSKGARLVLAARVGAVALSRFPPEAVIKLARRRTESLRSRMSNSSRS